MSGSRVLEEGYDGDGKELGFVIHSLLRIEKRFRNSDQGGGLA